MQMMKLWPIRKRSFEFNGAEIKVDGDLWVWSLLLDSFNDILSPNARVNNRITETMQYIKFLNASTPTISQSLNMYTVAGIWHSIYISSWDLKLFIYY